MVFLHVVALSFLFFCPGLERTLRGSRGGIPDILVVCFIAGMSGVLFFLFVRSLFRFGAGVGGWGWGAVAGGRIILTCPLCILIVVINNFVYST